MDQFPELRNDPTLDYLSHMSPYLHFGQISPLFIALRALETKSPGIEAFLEELIIRRELSMNFVFYNEEYDSFEAVPEWAKKTLRAHQKDARRYTYSLEEFESAGTHDPYWNAAQKEMVIKGKMPTLSISSDAEAAARSKRATNEENDSSSILSSIGRCP